MGGSEDACDCFAAWCAEPEGDFPLAVLDEVLREVLRTQTGVIHLSAATFVKQRLHHPDLTLDDYRRIPSLVARGLVILQEKRRLVFFRHAGRLFKVVVKVTEAGDALYLVSFHKADEGELRRELRRGRLLRGEVQEMPGA